MLEPPYSLKSIKYNSILLVKSLKLANQQETVLIITKQNYKFVLNFKKLIIQFKLINFIELKSLKKLLFLFHKLKKIIIMNKIGSSETIRKTTFNFYTYKENLVSHKKKINLTFLQWFIGFTEGDASFIVSNARLFFIINQKEEKILHFIRTNLGFGKVSKYGNYSRFIVADRTNIERLISIFNGNLILNKTNTRFIYWLDARNNYSIEKLDYLNKNELVNLDDSAWLTGFIDAEGCFNVVRLHDKRYTLGYRVRLRFILDQKNEIFIFNKLQIFLKSGVITKRKNIKFTDKSVSKLQTEFVIKGKPDTFGKQPTVVNRTLPGFISSACKPCSETVRLGVLENFITRSACNLQNKVVSDKSKEPMFRFTSTSVLSHEILIKYLVKFPLRTFKKVSFLRFTSLLRYIKNRKAVPWENKVLKKVEKLIKNV